MITKTNKKKSLWLRLYFWWIHNLTRVILITGFITFILAFIGIWELWQSNRFEAPVCDNKEFLLCLMSFLYRIAQVFSLDFDTDNLQGWPLVLASFFAAAFLLLSILKLLSYAFESMRLRWLDLFRWISHKRHIVICGLDKIGATLTTDYISQGKSVVILEKKLQNSKIQTYREKGAIILYGDATDHDALTLARAHKAERVFFVTESDAENIQAALDLHHRDGKHQPVCHIHLIDPLRAQLVEDECLYKVDKTCQNKPKIHTFNIYRATAKKFVSEKLMVKIPKENQK